MSQWYNLKALYSEPRKNSGSAFLTKVQVCSTFARIRLYHLYIPCNLLELIWNNVWLWFSITRYFKWKYVSRIINTKSSYTEPRDNLVLKSKFCDYKVQLSHGLILFKKERTSSFRNSTKKISETKLIGFLCLQKIALLCLQEEELLA